MVTASPSSPGGTATARSPARPMSGPRATATFIGSTGAPCRRVAARAVPRAAAHAFRARSAERGSVPSRRSASDGPVPRSSTTRTPSPDPMSVGRVRGGKSRKACSSRSRADRSCGHLATTVSPPSSTMRATTARRLNDRSARSFAGRPVMVVTAAVRSSGGGRAPIGERDPGLDDAGHRPPRCIVEHRPPRPRRWHCEPWRRRRRAGSGARALSSTRSTSTAVDRVALRAPTCPSARRSGG